MSIEAVASELSGIHSDGFVVVKAAKKGKTVFKTIKDLVKSQTEPELKAYAQAYYDYVQGGSKGKAPAAEGGSPLAWKYIRSTVHSILGK